MKPQLDEHLEQIPFQLRRIMKSKEKMNMGSSKLKKIMRGMDYNTVVTLGYP